MGFWGNIGGRVRGLLRFDKEQVVLNLAKGGTAAGYPQTGFDLLQAYGYDVLSDYLKLEHDLMARYVDYEEMDDYPELACITKESTIPYMVLPSNSEDVNHVEERRFCTVGELVEAREAGKIDRFFVFAFDHEAGKVKVAEAKGPVKTGTKPVYRVTYEDFRRNKQWSIKATGDHLFMLRDGEYRRVDHLRPGNRLMPCTVRTGPTGYAEVYEPVAKTKTGKATYKYVHQLVAGAVIGRDFEDTEVVHHINRDRTDYRPTNLEVTTLRAHVRDHWAYPGTHEEHVKKISEGTKKKWADPHFKLRVSRSQQSAKPEWLDNEKAGKHKRFRAEGKLSGEHRAAIAKGRTIPLARDVVEAAVRASSSLNDASKKLDVSWNTLVRRMGTFGIDRGILGSNLGGPQPGEAGYGNHRVVSVEYVGEEDVYDIEVPGYHNFAVGDAAGGGEIFIHNSAIDIYADDATQTEALQNKVVWVDSPDKTVETILNDLFHRRLRIDEEIWEMARTLVKYGNDYEELLVTGDGLVGLNFLPPPTMRRIEGRRGELYGFIQDFKGRFGYCVAKHSRIWAPGGMQEIQNFSANTIVGYKDGKLAPLPLKQRHASGTKRVFRVSTRHREVFLTEDHPVFVERPSGNCEWVKVKDIKIVRYNGAKRNIDYSRSDKIVISTRMPAGETPEWSSICKYDPFDVKWGDKGSPSQITMPERPAEDFCRLFGFLLGDGWIEGYSQDQGTSDDVYEHTGRGAGSGRVSFARGTNEEQNDLYEGLLASFGLEVKTKNNGEQSSVSSIQLARLFDSLGWINGSSNKRIPGWVYGLPEAHREAFMLGLLDADGWETKTCAGTPGWHIELANYDLVRDFKNLADGLGYRTGRVGSRQRKPGTVIENKRTGKSVEIQSQAECFNLHVSSTKFDQQFVAENVIEIAYHEDAEVFDLEVDDEAHNFIADGVVVHNSPDEFKQLLTQRLAGANQSMDKYAALEDWEVAHLRLRSKHRRSIYGYSILEPARWIWKRLMLLEDAAIVYRLQRAPQRYAFYIDVGDLPPKEAFAFLHKVRQQYKKTKFYNPQCLTAETCVTLLDGTDKSMAELSRDYADKTFDVFSYDLESGKVVPGKAKNPRLTHENAPIWRVVLDNGAIVRCTGNHPFLMRDGQYKAANTLEAGDSLMPLYMSRGSEGTQGYWMYQDPKTGRRRPVHKMVAESVDPALAKKRGIHVHHVDRNKENNAPGNLELLTAREHALRHPERAASGRQAFVKRVKEDAEFRESISERLENWRKNNPEEAQKFFSEHGKEVMAKRKALAAEGQAALLDIITAEVVRDSLVVAEELVDRLNENPIFAEIYESLPTTKSPKITVGCLHAFLKRQGFSGFKDFKRQKTGQARWSNRTYGGQPVRGRSPRNHKVVSVTFEGYEDVYNMDVEKYHNFALTGGVFVHNTGKLDLKFNPLSQDEDFFVPVRKGVQQTKIDVVGNPAWQHMEDIEYFKLKLYSAIKVPKVYLGSEAPRAKGVLSQEDVRFARTVLRLQRELRNGLKKMARVHLAALNINPAAVDYEIYMTIPSSIFELAQLEVRNAKADFAQRMSQFVSLHWILQKIFGLSDSEIEYIIKERHEEALADAEVQAKGMGLQMDVQNQAQIQQQAAAAKIQTQQAVDQSQIPQPGAGQQKREDGDAREYLRRVGSLSRMWPLMRQHAGFRPITEKELFTGNREHEKRVEDNLDRILEKFPQMASRLNELGHLLKEMRIHPTGR